MKLACTDYACVQSRKSENNNQYLPALLSPEMYDGTHILNKHTFRGEVLGRGTLYLLWITTAWGIESAMCTENIAINSLISLFLFHHFVFYVVFLILYLFVLLYVCELY